MARSSARDIDSLWGYGKLGRSLRAVGKEKLPSPQHDMSLLTVGRLNLLQSIPYYTNRNTIAIELSQ